MNRLSHMLWLMMLGTPLLAQSLDFNEARQEHYAVITLIKYCAGVETVSDSQRPRIFAQVSLVLDFHRVGRSLRAKWRGYRRANPNPSPWSGTTIPT